VVIHHPKCEVKCVCTDVDEWTATLLILVEEYAPCRNCTSADCVSFCIVYFTELAVLTYSFEVLGVCSLTVLLNHCDLSASFLSSFEPFPSFLACLSHWLFTHNVFACVKRIYCDEAV